MLLAAFSTRLVTADTPTSIDIPQIGGRTVRIVWQNDKPTATNVVYLHKLAHIPESGTTIDELTFDEFCNQNQQTMNFTEEIIAKYPSLEGSSLLYLPTNSFGQIMISNSSDSGVLVHSAFADYSDLWLELLLKRYNHDKELKSMNIGYIDADGSTNNFTSVALENELRRVILPLDDIPSGRRLVLNKADRKKNNRVIIDEMRFILGYKAAHTETNLIYAIPVAGKTSVKLKNLDRETDYMVSVSAVDSYGVESNPSPPIPFTTTSELEIGLSVRLR